MKDFEALSSAADETISPPTPAESPLTGVVVRAQAGFYAVHTASGEITCRIRGRLKHTIDGPLRSNPIAVGDRVRLALLPTGEGVVEEVFPRSRVFSRQARGDPPRQQVILANADQAIFVFSDCEPEPHFRLVDRFLAIAEAAELPALLTVNKMDLVDGIPSLQWQVYEEIGYPVIYTSIVTGQGIDALRQALAGKISVLSGPSGVGKSSLVNTIQPGLDRKVSEISQWSGKGVHTTKETVLLPLDVGGYIADTAGIRQLIPWDMEYDLDYCFREFRPYLTACFYADCFHTHEPDCAVRAAVQQGAISEERYESYIRFYEQLEAGSW
jgi:ribosome biogenesis GTPase